MLRFRKEGELLNSIREREREEREGTDELEKRKKIGVQM